MHSRAAHAQSWILSLEGAPGSDRLCEEALPIGGSPPQPREAWEKGPRFGRHQAQELCCARWHFAHPPPTLPRLERGRRRLPTSLMGTW